MQYHEKRTKAQSQAFFLVYMTTYGCSKVLPFVLLNLDALLLPGMYTYYASDETETTSHEAISGQGLWASLWRIVSPLATMPAAGGLNFQRGEVMTFQRWLPLVFRCVEMW